MDGAKIMSHGITPGSTWKHTTREIRVQVDHATRSYVSFDPIAYDDDRNLASIKERVLLIDTFLTLFKPEEGIPNEQ